MYEIFKLGFNIVVLQIAAQHLPACHLILFLYWGYTDKAV